MLIGIIIILILCCFILFLDYQENLWVGDNDKSHEFINVTYYGIHKLQCPICNATGRDLDVTGYDYIMIPETDTKDTITLFFCYNCSHESKAR